MDDQTHGTLQKPRFNYLREKADRLNDFYKKCEYIKTLNLEKSDLENTVTLPIDGTIHTIGQYPIVFNTKWLKDYHLPIEGDTRMKVETHNENCYMTIVRHFDTFDEIDSLSDLMPPEYGYTRTTGTLYEGDGLMLVNDDGFAAIGKVTKITDDQDENKGTVTIDFKILLP